VPTAAALVYTSILAAISAVPVVAVSSSSNAEQLIKLGTDLSEPLVKKLEIGAIHEFAGMTGYSESFKEFCLYFLLIILSLLARQVYILNTRRRAPAKK
jgi:hypothetical protein